MHIPLAFGLVGADGKRHAGLAASTAPRSRTACIHVRKRRHVIRFRDVAERPVALAQPRLFGAGHNRDRADARRARVPGAPRRRSVLALAGVQLAADRCADGRLHAGAAAASRLPSPPTRRAGRRDRRRRDAGAGIPGPGARAARRGRHRPRDRHRHRSRRDVPGARGAGRGDRRGQCRSLFDRLWRTRRRQSPFSPDAASAGRRALRGALLDLLSVADGDPVAGGRSQFAGRDQYDRPDGRAHRLAHRIAGRAETGGRSPRSRQRFRDDPLVLDKWFALQATAPGPASARPRQGADGPLRPSRSPTRTGCAP